MSKNSLCYCWILNDLHDEDILYKCNCKSMKNRFNTGFQWQTEANDKKPHTFNAPKRRNEMQWKTKANSNEKEKLINMTIDIEIISAQTMCPYSINIKHRLFKRKRKHIERAQILFSLWVCAINKSNGINYSHLVNDFFPTSNEWMFDLFNILNTISCHFSSVIMAFWIFAMSHTHTEY